ncbi:hypothetical protein [Brevundimonas faecalis]|uniref:Sel1 repeat family protein n=1 Tax=Brevundimonas faecalis TaxID=947378 RepID=A0ABV2R874_9CAUL
MFIAAAFAAMAALEAPQETPRPLPYEEAVRCAGLTQAASELEGGESAEGKALYDAALYWSLAAMQAATAGGRDPAAAEREQTRARLVSVQKLTAGDAPSRAALARCRQLTPDLG